MCVSHILQIYLWIHVVKSPESIWKVEAKLKRWLGYHIQADQLDFLLLVKTARGATLAMRPRFLAGGASLTPWPKTSCSLIDWKCCRLEIVRMNELDFQVEIWAIQLQRKVITLAMSLQCGWTTTKTKAPVSCYLSPAFTFDTLAADVDFRCKTRSSSVTRKCWMPLTGKSLYSQLIPLGFTAGGPVFSFVSGLHRPSDSSLCTELTAERGLRFLCVDNCWFSNDMIQMQGQVQLEEHNSKNMCD